MKYKQLELFKKRHPKTPTWKPSYWNKNTWYYQTPNGYPAQDYMKTFIKQQSKFNANAKRKHASANSSSK